MEGNRGNSGRSSRYMQSNTRDVADISAVLLSLLLELIAYVERALWQAGTRQQSFQSSKAGFQILLNLLGNGLRV